MPPPRVHAPIDSPPGYQHRQRVAAFAESVRATRPVEDGRAVRMPFDRSASRRNETLRRGAIDVPEAVVVALRKEAAGG
ncbi:hypothetical protein [Streptomyces iranensis]|uniref:hypothetical protein n=1 Tax=Streptomyces iranensis TaxID=576784 RepID=UPI0039B73EB0